MSQPNWDTILTSKKSLFSFNFKELWEYRDLIFIFARRDIISIYKQTILGPVWFLLGPLFTVFSYTFIFSEIAHLSTDGIPGPLFYLGGTTLWNYFQACFNGASSTFSANAGIFGKVYFPRLVTPISIVLSNFLKLALQFLVFIGFFLYYYFGDYNLTPNITILFIPIWIIVMAIIATGSGIIISSLTTKYRDLNMLVSVGIMVLMYATPIMYPISAIPDLYKPFLIWNPISPLIEAFRFAFTSKGDFSLLGLFYSFIFGVLILFFGIVVFNRTEKTFMDTV
jgi:lipopolysaccharide transport system permease protein